jgi:hypothetical protein
MHQRAAFYHLLWQIIGENLNYNHRRNLHFWSCRKSRRRAEYDMGLDRRPRSSRGGLLLCFRKCSSGQRRRQRATDLAVRLVPLVREGTLAAFQKTTNV